jgi:hypothetical protein
MKVTFDLSDSLRSYFEDSADETIVPGQLESIARAVFDHPQRRTATANGDMVRLLKVPRRGAQQPAWRLSPMTTFLRLAAVAAALGILVAVVDMAPRAIGPGGQNLLVTPSTAASPSTTPSIAASPSTNGGATTGPIDTSSWSSFRSDRYGFSIAHPADWSESPADRTWTVADGPSVPRSAADRFGSPTVSAAAWSLVLDASTTADAWIQSYCRLFENDSPCDRLGPVTAPVTMDGHPGLLVRFVEDTQAFIFVGDRMYLVAVWRPDGDASTAPYGGSANLLEGLVSTMHLLPAEPAAAPS